MSDLPLPFESSEGPMRLERAADGTVHGQVLAAVRGWVERHPCPDFPALSLAGMGEYTPQQVVRAIEAGNEEGQFFETLIVNGARKHSDGLAGVLSSFRGEETEPALRGISQTREKP